MFIFVILIIYVNILIKYYILCILNFKNKFKSYVLLTSLFFGIAIKVCTCNVFLCIFASLNYDNFGYEQYCFIPKKFLVAGIILYNKDQ